METLPSCFSLVRKPLNIMLISSMFCRIPVSQDFSLKFLHVKEDLLITILVQYDPPFCTITSDPPFCTITSDPPFCTITSDPPFCTITSDPPGGRMKERIVQCLSQGESWREVLFRRAT